MDEARRKTVKPPITVRWVARQIRQPGEKAIFAPTPALESMRTIISLASTDIDGRAPHVRDPASDRRTQMSAIDISRAYFNASTDGDAEPTYVMLPPEHPDISRQVRAPHEAHVRYPRVCGQLAAGVLGVYEEHRLRAGRSVALHF